MFRLLTLFFEIKAFLQRKVFLKNINPEDLVLDIGSGDKPFWRADIFVDLYLEDDQQRFSGSMVYDKKKIFINANVEKLPFKDKSFDFVFCSHLLEHVEHPDRAIKEIMRVGKQGYIEIPRMILDGLDPFPPHLWFCDIDNGILLFKRKGNRRNFFLNSIKKFGNSYFHDPLLQFFFIKDFNASFICYYWKKVIRFKIEKAEGKQYDYNYEQKKQHKKNFFIRISFSLYRLFYLVMNLAFYKRKKIDVKMLLDVE